MDMMQDAYKVLVEPSHALYKQKGSRFIAHAHPVADEESCNHLLQSIRKNYHDARHHCYAYRLGPEADVLKISDDGEPSGSAGLPILNQIKSFELTNILLVVVRYFGGTRLGFSGLINAYKTASRAALENAEIQEEYIYNILNIRCSYSTMHEVIRLIKQAGAEVIEQELTDACTFKIKVRRSSDLILRKRLNKIYTLKWLDGESN